MEKIPENPANNAGIERLERCEHCAFSVFESDDAPQGTCRESSPRVIMLIEQGLGGIRQTMNSVFPVVARDMFCYRYEPLETLPLNMPH